MIIFVFGSNLAGRHGKGAALAAAKWYGAKTGEGVGPMGTSWAIPTKDKNLQTLPLDTIKTYVNTFLAYAKHNHDRLFLVTAIGCGLAGYKHEQIAPMFKDAPGNCFFDKRWAPYL